MGPHIHQPESKEPGGDLNRLISVLKPRQLSYLSSDRLKRTTELLHKIRRLVELFSRCLESCDEPNEARIAIVDFLDPITIILTDAVLYLHAYSSGL